MNILVVDDEIQFANVIVKFLNKHDVSASGAYSPDEALRVFEETKPEIVLLDINMPGMDGLSVMKKMLAMDPRCTVYIMTGKSSPSLVRNAMSAGAASYFLKPVDFDKLYAIIKKVQEKNH